VEVIIRDGLRDLGDPGLLAIVLENLLGNAWKFTSKRKDANIELGVTEKAGSKAFFVRDDGAGFDMAYAGRLFGVFQRLHHAAEFEGTGIGLATVQRIVKRHGGRIWAEGEIDHGATFFFTLADEVTTP
jgi:light-regulated signal transduction histidine kinase (bacteriophytochrome)